MAQEHNYNGHYDEEQTLSVSEYISVLRRRWWIIVLAVALVVGPTAYYTFTTDPVYEATTTIMLHEEAGMQQTIFGAEAYRQQAPTINDQIHLLKSRSIVEGMMKELIISSVRDSLSIFQAGFSNAIRCLRENLSVNPVTDTNYFIEIAVKGSSPFEASYLANVVAEVYQELDRDFSRGEVQEVVDFLDEQLEKKERDLKRSEELLKNFQKQDNFAFLSTDAQETVNQLTQFESLYNEALTDLQAFEKRLEYLNQQLGLQKENLKASIAQISNPLIFKLREELAEIERNAAVLVAQGVSEQYSDLRMLRAKQKNIRQRLTDETQNLIISGLMPEDPLSHAQNLVSNVIDAETEIYTLKARSQALKRIVDRYIKKLQSFPEKKLRLARLERTMQLDENLYLMMKEKYEESRISMAGQIGKVRIIDRAVMPEDPIAPNKIRNHLLGLIFGLGLGICATLLLQYADTSVRNSQQIDRLGYPMMGAIPHIPSEPGKGFSVFTNHKNHNPTNIHPYLITQCKPKSPVSESYRTLRTNIQFSESDQKLCSILVTSPGPTEGKSTTVANLAITMAQMGFRTILIDTDLRRPILHRMFNLEKCPGISNLVAGRESKENSIQSTSVENLDVITCGTLPPNPSELLGSQRMRDLLKELKARYDFILLDSPPVIAVTDAQVLASGVDGVLLTVKSGKSQIEAVKQAHVLLNKVKARFLGIVLNDMRSEHTYGNYYHNYYHHDYDEKDDKRKSKRRRQKEIWDTMDV